MIAYTYKDHGKFELTDKPVPENIEPTALIVMGYPSEDAKPIELHYCIL